MECGENADGVIESSLPVLTEAEEKGRERELPTFFVFLENPIENFCFSQTEATAGTAKQFALVRDQFLTTSRTKLLPPVGKL
jgi:hypothetical protein